MNNPLGVYYAFWEKEWKADYFQYIKKIANLGFDVLEVEVSSLLDMSSLERHALAEAAKDAGIELTYCIGLPAQYDPSSEEAAVRKKGTEYVKRLIQCVGEMDGKILGGILYGSWPVEVNNSLTDKQPWWDRSVESVREYSKVAENEGVTCCMEIVNRYEQILLNTAEEGRRFIGEIGSPNVKLLLDAFHMNIEEDNIGKAIIDSVGAIGHFHIGETNRRVPGRGHMPWDEIFDALNAIHYSGRIVMEPFVQMGGTVGKNIKVWRELLANPTEEALDNEAAFALSFLRQKMAER